MKKIMLFVAAVLITLAANAQVLKVVSMQQLTSPSDMDVKVAGVSPDGDYVLLTTGSNKGLQRYDVATKTTTVLSEAEGAGYNVQISADGQEVVYRETTVGRDQLRRNNIVRKNFTRQRRNVIARGQRDMDKMATTDAKATVTISDRLMVLHQNGTDKTLAPNGTDKSYIWASISPDGTRLCYYVCGEGCFVSNIDGTNPQFIAHACRAAKWYNDNTLVGMADEDNGEFITASAIVAYTLDGRRQVLTDNYMIAMYPYVAKNLIVFGTEEGSTYMLNVK